MQLDCHQAAGSHFLPSSLERVQEFKLKSVHEFVLSYTHTHIRAHTHPDFLFSQQFSRSSRHRGSGTGINPTPDRVYQGLQEHQLLFTAEALSIQRHNPYAGDAAIQSWGHPAPSAMGKTQHLNEVEVLHPATGPGMSSGPTGVGGQLGRLSGHVPDARDLGVRLCAQRRGQ